MIFGPVAPFSQSMSPCRAMATHFEPKAITFGPPQNVNICYKILKIVIVRDCMYCKQRIMYCKYSYMPQRCRLYVAKTQIICCKYTVYMLQIEMYVSQLHSFFMLHIRRVCVANTQSLCCKYITSMFQIQILRVLNT